MHRRPGEDSGKNIAGSVAARPYPFVAVFVLHRSLLQDNAGAVLIEVNAGEHGAGVIQPIQQLVNIISVNIFLIW